MHSPLTLYHSASQDVVERSVIMRPFFFRISALLISSSLFVSPLFATDHDKDKKPAKTTATVAPVTAKEAAAGPESTKIMPLADIKPGMRGVAYTVFEGTKPEAMEVEVLGVLKNMNGPKSDLILTRLHGQKVEYTGVVAGMSGSPVYIDGKLIGALSFRIGSFPKE